MIEIVFSQHKLPDDNFFIILSSSNIYNTTFLQMASMYFREQRPSETRNTQTAGDKKTAQSAVGF